jgi:hypothetical protein
MLAKHHPHSPDLSRLIVVVEDDESSLGCEYTVESVQLGDKDSFIACVALDYLFAAVATGFV